MAESKLIDHLGNEKMVRTVKELQIALQEMANSGNSIARLETGEFGVLTIGIGSLYGFVEYMNNDYDPPYLAALSDREGNNRSSHSFVEFDAGGTLTPIPLEKCLPIEQTKQIVLDFFTNRKLPDYVSWKPI